MPKPISRKELIRRLRHFEWTGPMSGNRHMYMEKSGKRLPIPNPHGGDIDWTLTSRILKQAQISAKDWDALG